jgi:hypothetical protein
MARITRVAKAQQRYKTVPVLGEDGQPVKTPVINKRTGEQKVSKRGPVFMTKTVADKDQPLDLLRCDFHGCDINGGKIAIGTPYKHISPKSGPYGGRQLNRHAEHPDWNVWDYSSSASANVARIMSEGSDLIQSYEFTAAEDFDALRDDLAAMAQDFLDEKQESLDNMPEGLGEGSVLGEQVEALEAWVDEIGNAEAPEWDDACGDCEGTGDVDCEECGGTGKAEGTSKWYATGPDAQSLDEEGYLTEEVAQANLDAYLAAHPEEDADEWEVVESEEDDCPTCDGEGTTQCETCGGEGTIEGEASEEWVDEARSALDEALSNCDL